MGPIWEPGLPNGNGHCMVKMYPTALDNGRVRSSHPPHVTNSTQQGRHAAAMRAVATNCVTSNNLLTFCLLLYDPGSMPFVCR